MTVLPFETVTANPVFTFVVNVKNEDGSAGKDDLKITIKNESRDLKGNGLLGQPEAVSDNCPVTFIDLEDGLKVADIGDQTTIEVRFSQGKLLAPTTYQITASDVADARSVVDIRIEAVNIESVSISAEIAKSGDTLVFSMVGTRRNKLQSPWQVYSVTLNWKRSQLVSARLVTPSKIVIMRPKFQLCFNFRPAQLERDDYH